jgi:hypothetical protein
VEAEIGNFYVIEMDETDNEYTKYNGSEPYLLGVVDRPSPNICTHRKK